MRKSVLVVLLALLSFAARAEIYVVAVGVADYKHISDLKYTLNDITALCKVFGSKTKNITKLTEKDATHNKVIAALNREFGKAGNDDTVILIFSGHGYQGGFCCQDFSASTYDGGLSYQELQVIFKSCKAKHKIVFADTCFSGGLRRENRANPSYDSIKTGDVMFFLSCRTNETSQEAADGKMGQFSRFLEAGLRGKADKNRDRIITAKELYDFVHEGVIAATHDRQHPVMWGRFNNTMPVIDWR